MISIHSPVCGAGAGALILFLMNIAAILRELDAELERLHAIRGIVSGLALAAPMTTPRKPRTLRKPAEASPVSPQPELPAEPRLVVLPAKVKRQYGPRTRRVIAESKALAAPASDRPVFVPKTPEASPAPRVAPVVALDADAIEAALRKNLLGGAA